MLSPQLIIVSLIVALAMCAGTIYTLRGGFRTPQGTFGTIAGFDTQSMALAALSIAAATYFFGSVIGITLIFAVAVHEFGHVAAYRICGHSDARFRLIPLMGGVAISSSAPASQEKAFFISLMGPAICLAPAVLAQMAGYALYPVDRQVAGYLVTAGTFVAAFNFFNLLPFWPLDGGRMVHTLAWIFWKGGARYVAAGMSAAFAAYAFWSHSMILFMFALMGAQSLVHGETLTRIQRPMSKRRGLLALAAYLAVTGATFLAGYPFIAYQFL